MVLPPRDFSVQALYVASNYYITKKLSSMIVIAPVQMPQGPRQQDVLLRKCYQAFLL